MNTLVAKIAKASTVVGALQPDKRNQAQSYDYISADKVLQRVGDALAAEGIVIFPSVTSEATEMVATGNGKSRFDSTVHFGMIISDGESQIELPWCGRGSDFSVPDKALYKAITSGHKYFLMKLLNVGVGNEDSEHESSDDGQAAQDARQAPQARKTQPAPVDPDVLFAKDTERVTAPSSKLKRMHALGMKYYQTEAAWDGGRPLWVNKASGGSVESSNDLSPEQVDWIIERLEARIAKAAQEQEPVSA